MKQPKFSDNFELWEFACNDRASTPVPAEHHDNLRRLCKVLERIRKFIDRPISIISGYRTRAHNNSVNGAPDSTHLDASGADIRAGNPAELHQIILDLYHAGVLPDLGGIGSYPGWVHLDIRKAKDGHLRRWGGTGTGSEK